MPQTPVMTNNFFKEKETPKIQSQLVIDKAVLIENQENINRARNSGNSYDSDTSDITEFTTATEIKERPSTATFVKM